MFSLDIADSDSFLSLSPSAQGLYFQLGLRADDDGIVNKPVAIMRSMGAVENDMKQLLEKRFVIAMEDGVLVVKHWWLHNTKRKDRYTPSNYTEDIKKLYLDENGTYTTRRTSIKYVSATNWQPNDNQVATQDKISKDKLI